ncbi:leucine-rich repeat protein [Levilactobacillus cerevisiae]|uniref:leucine-rich repeat protein n=1 Tax=Levilactobacillus cerevisiae TaxID=1704076 RepID=UPI000F76F3B6|nr:leucine-rich repeat protein [Levilactobacillus cerevisiae]
MQTKQHYKMYKDGKHWVFAAITVAAVGLGTMMGQGAVAHADTTTVSAADSSSQTGAVAESTTAKSVTLTSGTTTTEESTGNSDSENVKDNASSTQDTTESNSGETGTGDSDTNTSSNSNSTDTTGKDTTSTDTPAPSTDSEKTTEPDNSGESAGSETKDSTTPAAATAPVAENAVNDASIEAAPAVTPDTDAITDSVDKLADDAPAVTADTPMTIKALSASLGDSVTLPATDQSYFNFTPNTDGTATLVNVAKQITDNTVVIPTTYTDSNGKVYQVTSIANYAFMNNNNFTTNVSNIVIGDGITSIGDSAFAYLSNLKVVDLSENHTLTDIGENAFVSSGISDLVLPATVKTIGDGAFKYNYNLTNVDFSQATNLASIGALAFAGDRSLTTLNIPTLTTMGTAAFTGATSLTTVTLGDGVQQVGDYAFSNYQDGDVNFVGDTALTSVTFGNGLQTIGNYAFTYDGGITSISLPASLTSIGDYAFGAMTSKDASGNTTSGLTSVTFAPDSQLKTIGNSAFIYDSFLDNVTLPASLQTIGDQAFLANSALTSINLPASLISVGANAFTYDAKLSTLDTSQATALTTIKSGAFEYAGLTGTLTLPENLTTIGDLAFAGNHLDDLVVNPALTTIGASAFAYNALGGNLDLTATALTSIGANAFYGNQLTGVQVPTTTTIGKNAFQYNRISRLTAGGGNASLALNQTATIFTSKNDLTSIDDLFTTAIGSADNSDLVLTKLSNGVTYSNGKFTIPDNVDGFTFNWTLTDSTGLTYAGTYQVVLNDPHIQVVNSTVWYGESWNPIENISGATMTDGTVIPKSEWSNFDVAVTDTDGNPVKDAAGNLITAATMTQTLGTYNVTYSYQGEQATAVITVQKREATFQLSGSSEVTYNGAAPVVDPADYTVTFSNGFIYTLKSGDLDVVANAGSSNTANVGTYTVKLNDAAIDRVLAETPAGNVFDWTDGGTTATVTVNPAVLTVTVKDASKDAGAPDPGVVLTTTVGASDTAVSDSGLTADDITRVPGEIAGMYQYQLKPTTKDLSTNYVIGTTNLGKLTINSVDPTLTGSDYTMNVNGTAPTATDFKPVATDTNAQAVAVSDITLDLGDADLTKAGDYPVTLTYAGLTKIVTLHVVTPTTGGGGGTTDPGNGGDPDVTDPTDPTDPATPTDPADPNEVHKVISDQGVHKDGVGATVNVRAKKSAQSTLGSYRGGIGATIQGNSGTLKHGGDGALITPTAKATSAQAKVNLAKADPVTSTTAKATLPQTNEAPTTWWAALGILLGGLGLAGLRKRRHE